MVIALGLYVVSCAFVIGLVAFGVLTMRGASAERKRSRKLDP